MKAYAISLKQPWAALLAHGLKTVEVRRWPTARRGRVFIHAARVSDMRDEAWVHVQPHLLPAAQLTGGIVGAGEIIGCGAYRTAEAFVAERAAHLNDPSWFQPGLHGFTFTNLTPLPFRAYPGWLRFFPVDDEPPVPS